MAKISLIFLVLLVFGCNTKREKEIVVTEVENTISKTITEEIAGELLLDSLKLNINFKPKGNYNSITHKIKTDRSYFKSAHQVNSTKAIDSASKYLYSKLINDIVPHWYETPWDFNGHTNSPKNGEIACGYFVSTTLKHLGFNLNRYKMAQAAGLNEAKLLQTRANLKIFSNVTFEQLKDKVNKAYSNGIYFVGLDNHVGYVLIKNKELYFLHSSYCDDKVVIELAENAPCFSSNLYVFAEITTNKKLVKSWVFSERLSIPSN
ncbi:hypothetical protein [Winogradskyella sp.]|uniref:hypothetical protein n=1 Tax=Winogradskyella sp. TaxID=1883156 RepID=UPI0025DB12C8|nr:hypothetical protein [Winogradskyella sp.]